MAYQDPQPRYFKPLTPQGTQLCIGDDEIALRYGHEGYVNVCLVHKVNEMSLFARAALYLFAPMYFKVREMGQECSSSSTRRALKIPTEMCQQL